MVRSDEVVSDEERGYRSALHDVVGLGPKRMKILLEKLGSAEAVWGLTKKELVAAGLPDKVVKQIVMKKRELNPLDRLKALAKVGVRVLLPGDAEYPRLLKEIENQPQVLYVKGSLVGLQARVLSVVGTRYPTPYGREAAERLVAELVGAGWVIVSGLARGIDGVAHRVTVEQRGRTVAVLGCGLDKVYPPEHAHLARRILDSGGSLVSEYAPGMMALPGNFPARNRIIAGMSLGVLVVEGAHKSGTKITARLAVEQGREVFAVPGPITSFKSQATADLLKNGAKIVTKAHDIMEEFDFLEDRIGSGAIKAVAAKAIAFENKEEKLIFNLLEGGQKHLDELVRESGLETAVVSSALSMMEIKGMVKQLGVMIYTVKI